jgi:hypothetical protein
VTPAEFTHPTGSATNYGQFYCTIRMSRTDMLERLNV